MSDNNNNNNNKALIALLGGFALGAIIGILFAPDKGSETRKKAAGAGKKIFDDLKDKFGGEMNGHSHEEKANTMSE